MKIPSVRRTVQIFSDFSGGVSGQREENLLPQRYARAGFNFASGDGALRGDPGVSALSAGIGIADKSFAIAGESVEGVYYFRRYDHEEDCPDDKLLFYTASHKIYASDLCQAGAPYLVDMTFSSRPFGVGYRLNGEDVIILATETDAMTVWDGVNDPYQLTDAPRVSSLCVHYERLFATAAGENTAVWFSDDLNVTNWNVSLDEAGFIENVDEGGGFLKAVSFLDSVYLFRSYGISRLTAYADQTAFRLSRLFVSAGRILPDTVCVCGDRINFLTEQGLYSFDGYDTVRLCPQWDRLILPREGSPSAAFAEGNYLLCCRADFGESGAGNNALLIAGREQTVCKMPVDFVAALSAESRNMALLCAEGKAAMLDKSGKWFGQALEKRWETPFSDLNRADAQKVAQLLTLNADGPCTVTVRSERGSRTLSFAGTGAEQKRFSLRGTRFSLEISSEAPNLCLSKPELTICTLRD